MQPGTKPLVTWKEKISLVIYLGTKYKSFVLVFRVSASTSLLRGASPFLHFLRISDTYKRTIKLNIMKNGKFYLLLGNIVLAFLSDEDLKHFKTDNEQKALVVDLNSVLCFDTESEAEERGEEAICNVCESYLVLGSYTGEVAYENEFDKNEVAKVILSGE